MISNFFPSETVFKLLAPLTSFTSFKLTFTSFATFKPFPTSSFKNYVGKSLKTRTVGSFKRLVS